MEQSVNERFLKLSSRLPFYKDIELGQDLTLNIEGQTFIVNCVKQEVFDKQDGRIEMRSGLRFCDSRGEDSFQDPVKPRFEQGPSRRRGL